MLLSWLIWLPIAAGIALLVMEYLAVKVATVRWSALAMSAVTMLLAAVLWAKFDTSMRGMQFVVDVPWVAAFGIDYALGVDGIAMPLIMLNTIITFLTVAAGWKSINSQVALYMAAFLLMSGFVNGVFVSTDAILFYVFWEATLIPLFLVIGIWGGERRIFAALKFFLFTLSGSLLMLIAFIYLYKIVGNFDILAMHHAKIPQFAQGLVFFAFFAAFAVKVPMVPVHTWLPDAHVEAPTGGSIVLAALMLKLGGYGFYRFSLPIVPEASQQYAWVVILLSLVAIVYIGLVALAQTDMKKLVAYSSIAHMGFVTLGVFVFTELGLTGGMVQMISHGFVSGAMFCCIGVLYDRMHSRNIADYGGVVNTMPRYATLLMLFAMANAGLPGTSGFVGEFMVILAAIKANLWWGVIAATTLITGAAYTLWMYKRVIFGEIANDKVRNLSDISTREYAILGTFAFFVILLGVYPQLLTTVMQVSIGELVEHVQAGKL